MSWPSVSPGAGASESRWADILGPDDAVRRTTSGRLLKGSGNEILLRHLIHLGSLQTENISQRWSLRGPPRWRWILSRLLWDSRPIKCCYCCSNKEKIRKKKTNKHKGNFRLVCCNDFFSSMTVDGATFFMFLFWSFCLRPTVAPPIILFSGGEHGQLDEFLLEFYSSNNDWCQRHLLEPMNFEKSCEIV